MIDMSSCFPVENWPYNSFPLTPNSSTSCNNSPGQPWNEPFIMTPPPTSCGNISLEVLDQRSPPPSDFGACMNGSNLFQYIDQNTSMNKGADWLDDFTIDKSSGYLNAIENQIPVFDNLTSESQPVQFNSFLHSPYVVPTMPHSGVSPEILDHTTKSSWDSISMQPGSMGKYPGYPLANKSPESNIPPVSFQSATLDRMRHDQEPDREKEGRKRAENRGGNNLRFIPGNTIYLPSSAKKCLFPGCGKKFVRQEHLKRHERTHYSSDRFVCPFCKRAFSRDDNLTAHIKLHGKGGPDRPNRRTQYFIGAARLVEDRGRKRQKKTNYRGSSAMEMKLKEK